MNIKRLVGKLARSGRAFLYPARRSLRHKRVGAFCVAKDDDFDGFILDARLPNCFQLCLLIWTMTIAHMTCLPQTVLGAGDVLPGYLEEFRDYCVQFEVSERRAERNTLMTELTASEVLEVWPDARVDVRVPVDAEGPSVVGFKAIAPGDCDAVEFGQTGHCCLVARFGAIKDEGPLMMHRPAPRWRFTCGAVIDDLGACEKEAALRHCQRGQRLLIPKTLAPLSSVGPDRLKSICKEYKAHTLENHAGKSIWREPQFQLLGRCC